MNTSTKVAISAVCSFITGAIQYYFQHVGDPWGTKFWVSFIFAGVAPVATYFLGFAQVNPNNQPKTKEGFLRVIEDSGDKAATVKREMADALAETVPPNP